MKSEYILPHEAFILLSNIWLHLTRIQNEGDAHSNAIATNALKKVKAIQDMAKKIDRSVS